MTRTAPVPNIPAPPGMNPGAFVAGGGGNGGGSGGRGSGNGSGEEGADGADNDENAEGEGNAANACGEGDAGACPNPEHGGGGGLTEGDPVDAISGRVFTTPSVELILRGPLPLVIKRQYSSDAVQRDIGLGYGWSHSLAWRVQVKRRAVLLLQPSGQQRRFRRFDVGQSRTFGRRVLTRSPNAFVLQEGFSRFLFEREAEGSDHYRLAAIEDTFGNRTRLDYNEGRLVGGEDCVGRSFRVVWSGEHIVAFETFETDRKRWKRFFTYGYADGDLTQATDALGNRTTYEYAQHRLVRHTTPTGRTAHFRYDQAGACVECWVDYGDRADPALDADVPQFLADGTTKARGMYHCVFTRDDGYLETVNSRQVKRASTNVFGKADAVVSEGSVSSLQYDDGGNIVSYADGNGATWSWVRDAQGRILEETNPLGESRRYEYNPSGHLLSTTEPDGYRTTQLLDRHGYLLGVSDDEGEIISYEYDARGLCTQAGFPNGGRARMSYDQYGNRAEIIELGGERAYIDYNHFGKPIRHHDGKGKETRFIYDEMLQLICVVNPDGTRQHWSYDADGNLSSLTKPDGAQYQFEWGGVKSTCCVRRPDGTEIHFRYDREGNLVRVINERGEEHRLERDAAGRVVREHTFDGRKLTYTLDLAGNLARIQDHSGAFVDLEYDVLGRVVARTFADDSVETFAYDVRGRLIQATHGESRCEFQYDPRGQLVRQLQALDGVEEYVEAEYDLTGNRTLLRTSRGHEERGAFDVARRMTQLELGHGNDPLRFGYDELDREVSRVLPGGGKILQGFDGMDRLAWREIVWGEEQSKGPEPAWVGARPTQSRRQAFGYDLRGLLAQIMDSAHGATQLSYDRLARVVENSLNGVARESFRYDEVDNVYDAGLARDYAVGGRLLRRGNTSYEYDADG
ncbi:MAG: RHS repeat protein, partial [Myxococcales bacterium]|nr:RHS repeat protein [Myxococcales bacterium]